MKYPISSKTFFGFDIPVIIRTRQQIDWICESITDLWQNNSEQKTDVLFLWSAIDDENIIQQLPTTEIDNVQYLSSAVVWHINRENANKSGLRKLVGTRLYHQMTVRNINTVRKINQMLSYLT